MREIRNLLTAYLCRPRSLVSAPQSHKEVTRKIYTVLLNAIHVQAASSYRSLVRDSSLRRGAEGRTNRSSAAASCSTKISLRKAYHGDPVRIFARIRVRRNVPPQNDLSLNSLRGFYCTLLILSALGLTLGRANVFPSNRVSPK